MDNKDCACSKINTCLYHNQRDEHGYYNFNWDEADKWEMINIDDIPTKKYCIIM